MRRHVRVLTVILALLLTHAAVAQLRGKGRLQGSVIDKTTGKPVSGATVTLSGGNTSPLVVKTNAKGQWTAIGLVSGSWNIDIEASGYETTRGTVSVAELQMTPPIKTEIVPAVPVEEVPAGPTVSNVPQEVVDAVNEAQSLMKIAVGEDVNGTPATADTIKANNKKAAELIDTALPQIPTDTPERIQIRGDLQALLAQAWYKAGDITKAISVLKTLAESDPANTTHALLLTNLYLENSQLAEGKAMLESLPQAAISDPTVYLNVGILFYNKNSPADAAAYFDKAIALDETKADAFYYRGLAHLQLKNNAKAKADFERVVALAPDSPEARDSKQLLASLK